MMTDERLTDFLVEFKASISELNAMMKSTLERIANHEERITNLEQSKTGLKDDFIKMLVRTLTISVVGLVVLGGGAVGGAKCIPRLALCREKRLWQKKMMTRRKGRKTTRSNL